jgi:hypothetical protein
LSLSVGYSATLVPVDSASITESASVVVVQSHTQISTELTSGVWTATDVPVSSKTLTVTPSASLSKSYTVTWPAKSTKTVSYSLVPTLSLSKTYLTSESPVVVTSYTKIVSGSVTTVSKTHIITEVIKSSKTVAPVSTVSATKSASMTLESPCDDKTKTVSPTVVPAYSTTYTQKPVTESPVVVFTTNESGSVVPTTVFTQVQPPVETTVVPVEPETSFTVKSEPTSTSGPLNPWETPDWIVSGASSNKLAQSGIVGVMGLLLGLWM